MPDFRFWLVAFTIPKALSRFFPNDGDPVPTRFNCQAAAHTVDPVQFTSLNALIGLMLATGLVVEVAETLAEFAERSDPEDLASTG
jgi:hypothetical protein